MPTPLEVFETPQKHWDLLTSKKDVELEDQFFDRKEACCPDLSGSVSGNQLSGLIDTIRQAISAFANENKEGGLLVLGISKTGDVKGMAHLSDPQRNSLMRPGDWLVGQDTKIKLHDCHDSSGKPAKVCLMYVPYTPNAICETIGATRYVWRRQGAQNIQLNTDQIDQLRRDKKITSFEDEYCCSFDIRDVDLALLAEFRKVFHSDSRYAYSDEELLYQSGALMRDGKSYNFNNAGFLFFSANPQRVLTWASVRLIRNETLSTNPVNAGLVSLDKYFTGSLPQQIRNVRAYFQESGFFKRYQRRNKTGGGFTEEPELPFVAVDEAIVNAVVHRDYAVKLPIDCRKFSDAFVVGNPGRVLQRERGVPKDFSLADVALDHVPRNPRLLHWLKLMKDEQGAEFVRALSEGTRKMRDEMQNLALPAPHFHVTPPQTVVTLFNNAAEREALLRAAATGEQGSEFTNLFPVKLTNFTALNVNDFRQIKRDITFALRGALQSHDWYIDRVSYRLRAHKRGTELPLPREVAKLLRFYPAYEFQVREYWSLLYLAIDYSLEVKNVRSVNELLSDLSPEALVGRTAVAFWQGWQNGRIRSAQPEWTEVQFFDFGERVETVPSTKVIPNLGIRVLESLLSRRGVSFDLGKAIKQYSLASEPNASRTRAARTQAIADELATSVFPIATPNDISVNLQHTGATVSRNPNAVSALHASTITEPSVEFHHQQESPDIRDGITRFGAYDKEEHDVELVPFCTPTHRQQMSALIDRLKAGKFKYKGAERTFSTRFTYGTIVTVPDVHSLEAECNRLLHERPTWVGNPALNRLFLIHTPERGYSLDDETSPYYRLKRLMLEAGIPCQMVDTPTLIDPDWKDLNLALNIIGKCGVIPWVLPDKIPDADFFVGLSYTQSQRQKAIRMMGYANVFNAYGRWSFYSANSEAFPYEEKTKHFRDLVKTTLEQLSLQDTPSIYFHYSAKFSRDDKTAILEAARSVRPNGTYSFVWINTDHNVRFYDRSSEGDGSMGRGAYVVTSPHQIYISTTGFNPYRRSLGTPLTLELNIHTEERSGKTRKEYDLRALAFQILSLTKLNWASTDSLCGEPITTKYAGDIAYLTSAFLRQQGPEFKLHPVLVKTPWFI